VLIVELVDWVPSGVWVVVAGASVVASVAMWSVARRRLRRAGERVANPLSVRGSALTVAAMVPATLFWGMVLAGSLHGLVAFGRNVLAWHGGWEYLVPGTLDGVSVTFAFLAFRAVRKQKAPDRCQRVVWGAALASATVNFAYEYSHSGHNVVAGGYLGLLSLFGMVMFHEFLDQFEEGAAYGDLAFGPLTDELARGRYDLSAKQLRNIRHAATSGVLRRRAEELDVRLPPEYVDMPKTSRVNGHAAIGASM
jgi:hypothetical protein